jgi:hypothetical protein
VLNLTKGNYKLVGVRLDILENRRVAAIVYKHQDYFINVFVWPAADHAIDTNTQALLEFNLCGWNRSGLSYLIVSKLFSQIWRILRISFANERSNSQPLEIKKVNLFRQMPRCTQYGKSKTTSDSVQTQARVPALP